MFRKVQTCSNPFSSHDTGSHDGSPGLLSHRSSVLGHNPWHPSHRTDFTERGGRTEPPKPRIDPPLSCPPMPCPFHPPPKPSARPVHPLPDFGLPQPAPPRRSRDPSPRQRPSPGPRPAGPVETVVKDGNDLNSDHLPMASNLVT